MKKPKIINKALIIESQDPKQFCLRMVTEIQHAIDPSFLENLNLDRIRRYFFVGQGWRLTATGCTTIADNYIHYTSKNEKNKVITGKLLLNMDNAVGGPWFIRGSQIVVFDPTAHFELEMVGGDLNTFVDFKNSK